MSIQIIPNPVAIYKITNTVNSKVYIGQSVDPKTRWKDHKVRAGKKPTKVARALYKYGKEAFTFKVLVWCPDKQYADNVEIKLISAYDSITTGYNMCIGGEGQGAGENHPGYKKPLSEEHKAKLKVAKNTPEAIAKRKARKHTPEAIEKMKAARSTPEAKARTSEVHKGKIVSLETKEIMSGRKHSPETRAKISARLKGLKRTPEQSAQNSATQKEVWIKRKEALI